MSTILENNQESKKNKKRKLTTDTVITTDNYMNLDLNSLDNLEEFKQYLYKQESYLKKKIIEIKELEKEANRTIAKKCKEKNKDHEWIREREDCMYGSTFTLCKKCNIDYYDRSYMHY